MNEITYCHRVYVTDRGAIWVRDVLSGGRFIRCEAAMLAGSHTTWKQCPEGDEFSRLPIYEGKPRIPWPADQWKCAA